MTSANLTHRRSASTECDFTPYTVKSLHDRLIALFHVCKARSVNRVCVLYNAALNTLLQWKVWRGLTRRCQVRSPGIVAHYCIMCWKTTPMHQCLCVSCLLCRLDMSIPWSLSCSDVLRFSISSLPEIHMHHPFIVVLNSYSLFFVELHRLRSNGVSRILFHTQSSCCECPSYLAWWCHL